MVYRGGKNGNKRPALPTLARPLIRNTNLWLSSFGSKAGDASDELKVTSVLKDRANDSSTSESDVDDHWQSLNKNSKPAGNKRRNVFDFPSSSSDSEAYFKNKYGYVIEKNKIFKAGEPFKNASSKSKKSSSLMFKPRIINKANGNWYLAEAEKTESNIFQITSSSSDSENNYKNDRKKKFKAEKPFDNACSEAKKSRFETLDKVEMVCRNGKRKTFISKKKTVLNKIPKPKATNRQATCDKVLNKVPPAEAFTQKELGFNTNSKNMVHPESNRNKYSVNKASEEVEMVSRNGNSNTFIPKKKTVVHEIPKPKATNRQATGDKVMNKVPPAEDSTQNKLGFNTNSYNKDHPESDENKYSVNKASGEVDMVSRNGNSKTFIPKTITVVHEIPKPKATNKQATGDKILNEVPPAEDSTQKKLGLNTNWNNKGHPESDKNKYLVDKASCEVEMVSRNSNSKTFIPKTKTVVHEIPKPKATNRQATGDKILNEVPPAEDSTQNKLGFNTNSYNKDHPESDKNKYSANKASGEVEMVTRNGNSKTFISTVVREITKPEATNRQATGGNILNNKVPPASTSSLKKSVLNNEYYPESDKNNYSVAKASGKVEMVSRDGKGRTFKAKKKTIDHEMPKAKANNRQETGDNILNKVLPAPTSSLKTPGLNTNFNMVNKLPPVQTSLQHSGLHPLKNTSTTIVDNDTSKKHKAFYSESSFLCGIDEWERVVSTPRTLSFRNNDNIGRMKIVSGTYHQGHSKFPEECRNRQCTANSLIAIVYHNTKNVSLWTTWDVDKILDNGNDLYKNLVRSSSIHNDFLLVPELPTEIEYEGNSYFFSLTEPYAGLLFTGRDDISIFDIGYPLSTALTEVFRKHSSLFITFGGNTVSVICDRGIYYLFDPHSRNELTGLMVMDDGKSIVVQLKTISDLQNHLLSLAGSMHLNKTTQYEITGIHVYRQEKEMHNDG